MSLINLSSALWFSQDLGNSWKIKVKSLKFKWMAFNKVRSANYA